MKTAFILKVDDMSLGDHRGDDVTKGQRLLSSYRKKSRRRREGKTWGGGKEKWGEEIRCRGRKENLQTFCEVAAGELWVA